MRPPRFTIQTLMIAVPVAGFALTLAVRFPLPVLMIVVCLVWAWGCYRLARRAVGGDPHSFSDEVALVVLTVLIFVTGIIFAGCCIAFVVAIFINQGVLW